MIEWSPFLAGLAAGPGIALHLGAIGVLILREDVERGIRAAGVAALAAASVDFGFALDAVVVGERIATAGLAQGLVGPGAGSACAVGVFLGSWRTADNRARWQGPRPTDRAPAAAATVDEAT